MTKSFALAAAEANRTENADERLPFQMEDDDTQLYAYPPTEGQMALMVGVLDIDVRSAGVEAGTAAASVLGVFWELMDEETAAHLRRRLRDRRDPFGLTDVMNIIAWLVEEAAARPTKPSSGSTPTPPPTGSRSTGRAPKRASTRSPSPRTGSAT